MQREFLQEKSLNRANDNAEKSLNVDLSAKSRLIPYSTTAGMLGLNDLYVEERDSCENYRLIFTVNPVCTNVIYNAVTEPVYQEGSQDVVNLVETPISRTSDLFKKVFGGNGTINTSGNSIDQIFAVRDTEISHSEIGNFKYHCGYDFFNNHLMRTNEFEHVTLENPTGTTHKNSEQFNTIFDFAIDYSGKSVERVINESEGPIIGVLPKTSLRMYQLDNIRTMNTAFYDEMRSVDGWYGFYNTGYINIPNAIYNKKEISLNRVLNNETPCGFIDLYPDRTLYSFIPKVNRYRKRLERNWDCTIVYPFMNDEKMFAKVNENEANAVKILSARLVYNNVGDEMVEMYSLLRHTLTPGDSIRIFYSTEEETSLVRYSLPVTIVSVGNTKGDEENRYFVVKLNDIATFCEANPETKEIVKKGSYVPSTDATNGESGSVLKFFYRKIENGYDNRYYFRKFKKIKNFDYIECGPGEVVSDAIPVSDIPSMVNEKSPKKIEVNGSYFKLSERDLVYTQNKIAFGENIYGDRVAQVIFNDDVCVTGLKDNLGRPLSSVYFMVEKTNRGHKEWYEMGDLSADTVEYSHCFGEITSGLDLPWHTGATEYNVRKLYNIFSAYTDTKAYSDGLERILSEAPTGNYSGTPTPIESGLSLMNEEMDEFYGDIVEFSKVNFTETVLEKVYHRFNTAQRELLENDKYFDINYDELVGDLYDVGLIS